jgi:hypothetical protein
VASTVRRFARHSSRLFLATILASSGFIPAATVGIQRAAATAADVGYRDFAYTGASDAAAASLQSKLWYHDGHWFGVLFDDVGSPAPVKFRIWQLNMTTQEWSDSGVAVDDRNGSRADVLASGDTLYVASSHPTLDVRFYRFTYNSVSNTYSLDSGFPKTIANTTTGTGYVSLTQAANGDLWMVFPQKSGTPDQASVYYSTSTDSGATWATPAVLPAQSSTIKDEDVAAITPLGSGVTAGVGVLWGDQNAGAFYFSAHLDSAPAGTWGARETAYGPPDVTNAADNHMSVKTDASGRVVAAVKTSMTGGTSPLIVVLRRSTLGVWENHTVSTKSQDATRPMLLLDTGANQAAVYTHAPAIAATGQRKLYRHTASLDTLDFGTPSLGSLVISNAADPALSDPTSTKQLINGFGQVVEVSDATTHRYLHSCLGGPCPSAGANVGPTISGFTQGYVTPSTMGSNSAVVRLRWSASDPDGISKYSVRWSLDSGATWHLVKTATPTSTSATLVLAVAKQYRFRVSAYDTKGAVTNKYLDVRIGRAQENVSAIHYSASWHVQSTSSASAGALKYTTVKGRSATYTFVGHSIGFVGWTGPTRGQIKVYIDNSATASATIDLRTSSNLSRRVLFSKSWFSQGTHSIKIVLTGTSGRWRADVDAFLVGRDW